MIHFFISFILHFMLFIALLIVILHNATRANLNYLSSNLLDFNV